MPTKLAGYWHALMWLLGRNNSACRAFGSIGCEGDLAGFWSVTVSANWRVIFCFEEGDATDVDLVDYH
jgi:hypothetical protein